MTWTRHPDDFTDRPDLLSVSRSARLLHVEATVYCNRLLTDGLLPRGALPRITDAEDPSKEVAELVGVGLWSEVATGWLIDWSDQEKAEKVKARRADAKARKELWQERGERHRKGDHSICTRNCPHVRNAVANTVPNDVPNDTPTRPDPTRPQGRGEGGDGIGRIAALPGSADAPPVRSLRAPEEKRPTLRKKKQPDGSTLVDMPGPRWDEDDEWP